MNPLARRRVLFYLSLRLRVLYLHFFFGVFRTSGKNGGGKGSNLAWYVLH